MNRITVCRISFAVLACFFVLVPVAAAQSSAKGAENDVKITGTLSCSMFARTKPYRKGFTTAEAVHLCISQGYGYVIVSGRNIYPIDGDKKQLWKLSGETVSIIGHVDEDKPKDTAFVYNDKVQATTIAPASN
jgi:hypothetical protein